MIWLIIIFALCVSVAAYEAWQDTYDRIGTFFMGLIGSFFATAALTAAVWGCLYPFTGPVRHTQRTELLTLQDGPGVTGRFFLGIGTVSGDLTVSYYVQRGGLDGYAVPNSVSESDDDIRIYQNLPAGQAPYVVRVEADPHFWTGSLYNGAATPVRYEFHVPAGTVKRDYSLDAK